MNRRQFLTLVASVGVSAALPAKSIANPIPLRSGMREIACVWPGNVAYIPWEDLWNNLAIDMGLAPPGLDSRPEPWHDPNAGDVPVQE